MKKQRTHASGFTLVELMAVCGIIAVVSAIVLANNNRYGGQVLLQNFAYDVALSIRQAQVYGISVERFGSGAGSTYGAGYGIHFDINTPTVYHLFADVSGTGLYDPTKSEDVSPSPYTIGSNYAVSDLCYTPGTGGAEVCSSAGTIKTIDILFIRPEPDALITACGTSCASSCLSNSSVCAASARIELVSPRGDKMSVSVEANGQIAVDQRSTTSP